MISSSLLSIIGKVFRHFSVYCYCLVIYPRTDCFSGDTVAMKAPAQLSGCWLFGELRAGPCYESSGRTVALLGRYLYHAQACRVTNTSTNVITAFSCFQLRTGSSGSDCFNPTISQWLTIPRKMHLLLSCPACDARTCNLLTISAHDQCSQ